MLEFRSVSAACWIDRQSGRHCDRPYTKTAEDMTAMPVGTDGDSEGRLRGAGPGGCSSGHVIRGTCLRSST